MAANKLPMWDHLSKPMAGQMIYDNMSMQAKIFDGCDWLPIDIDNLEDLNQSALDHILYGRKNMTDEWLEGRYDDLKQLRDSFEREYNTLRDKYKVFEIIKRSGEDNEN